MSSTAATVSVPRLREHGRVTQARVVVSEWTKLHSLRSTRCACSSAEPCEKFMRTTSSPASIMRESVFLSLDAGPRVATILVRRGMPGSLPYAARCSRISTAGSFLPSRNSRKAPPPVEI